MYRTSPVIIGKGDARHLRFALVSCSPFVHLFAYFLIMTGVLYIIPYIYFPLTC